MPERLRSLQNHPQKTESLFSHCQSFGERLRRSQVPRQQRRLHGGTHHLGHVFLQPTGFISFPTKLKALLSPLQCAASLPGWDHQVSGGVEDDEGRRKNKVARCDDAGIGLFSGKAEGPARLPNMSLSAVS